ncbi:MAG: Rrf2 family transcriptional regulator [Planctomycetaceae bacterium]|nr:Rrf2 family transcriptional regulator [Planctomycetaceae bacterium]
MSHNEHEQRPVPCYLVADDPSWKFHDTECVFENKGAVLFKLDDGSLANELVTLFTRDSATCPFRLSIIEQSRISPQEAVLAEREIDLAYRHFMHWVFNNTLTKDVKSQQLRKYSLRLAELHDEMCRVLRGGAVHKKKELLDGGNTGNFPALQSPETKTDALDQLGFVLDRHRLVFLFSVIARRINPLAIRSRAGVHERKTKEDVRGFSSSLSSLQIDCEGRFLFALRRHLDAFADFAYAAFGRGPGIKVDAPDASFPFWEIEEGLAVHLNESSETILLAAKLLRQADISEEFSNLVMSAINVAFDQGECRWYSSRGVRWEYLANLESLISSVKTQLILCPLKKQSEATITEEQNAEKPGASMKSVITTRIHDLPHAFMQKYESASQLLYDAAEHWRMTLRVSNPELYLHAIETFVHELSLVPQWFEELKRRSVAVEDACCSASLYAAFRTAALQCHSAIHENTTIGKLALDYLRQSITESPDLVSVVIDTRSAIHRLLSDEAINLSEECGRHFRSWHDECRRIQLDCERLSVDGCRCLVRLYSSFSSDASDDALAFQSLMRSALGGGYLSEVLAAVHAMADYASRHPKSIDLIRMIPISSELSISEPTDMPLSPRAQSVLVAMLEMNAVDSDSLQPTEDIAARALGTHTSPDSLKTVMPDLKRLTLIETRAGRCGGCWLTEKGRIRAEKLRQR